MLSLKYDYEKLIDILENNVSESSIDTRKYGCVRFDTDA